MVEGHTLAVCGISVSKVFFKWFTILEKLLHTWNLSLYSVGVDGEHDLLEVPPELVAESGLLAVKLGRLLLEANHQGRVLPFNFLKSFNCHFP